MSLAPPRCGTRRERKGSPGTFEQRNVRVKQSRPPQDEDALVKRKQSHVLTFMTYDPLLGAPAKRKKK